MAVRDITRGAAGLISSVNDNLTTRTVVAGTGNESRVLVLGFFRSGKNSAGQDLIPVQEVYPEIVGTVNISTLIRQTLNVTGKGFTTWTVGTAYTAGDVVKDADGNQFITAVAGTSAGTSADLAGGSDTAIAWVSYIPVTYPSEVSTQLEELALAGTQRVQVIRLGDDARYMDVTSRMARERYIALENAYDLIQDTEVDVIVPCNVVAGKNGDGLYNGNTLGGAAESVSVVYDPDLYEEVKAATPNSARLKVSSVYGFVAGDEVNYLKGSGAPDLRVEDLAYQAADIAQTISENGNYCFCAIRTMNPVEVRHLTEVSLGDTAVAGTDFGATATVVTGVTGAATWALTRWKGKSFKNDYDFAGANTLLTNKQVLTAIEEVAYFVDRTSNHALGASPAVKDVFRLTTQPIFTVGSVSQRDVISWSLAFGTPTRGEMKKWSTFIVNHGNGSSDVYQDSVASFIDMDGVTSANQEVPDNYLFYVSSDHEKPISATDTDLVSDENSSLVDLGAHLDVLAANSILPVGINANLISSSNPKSFTFGAGVGQKVGWYNTLPNNRSALALTTLNLRALGFLGGRDVHTISRQGFQLFRSEDGLYTFQKDITKARWVNDVVRSKFTGRFTTRVLKQAQDFAMAEGKRLRGYTDSPENLAGVQQRITEELKRWQDPVDGRLRANASIGVSVSSTAAGEAIGRLIIRLALPVTGEIQEVNVITDVNFA